MADNKLIKLGRVPRRFGKLQRKYITEGIGFDYEIGLYLSKSDLFDECMLFLLQRNTTDNNVEYIFLGYTKSDSVDGMVGTDIYLNNNRSPSITFLRDPGFTTLCEYTLSTPYCNAHTGIYMDRFTNLIIFKQAFIDEDMNPHKMTIVLGKGYGLASVILNCFMKKRIIHSSHGEPDEMIVSDEVMTDESDSNIYTTISSTGTGNYYATYGSSYEGYSPISNRRSRWSDLE